MEVRFAVFTIQAWGQQFWVQFLNGKVRVRNTLESIEYANPKAEWKPCATHAKQLVQLAFGAKLASKQAQRRARDTKPSLRVIG